MKKLLALLFALLATPAAAQTIPAGAWGSINYWGVGGLSQVLAPGLAGQCLTSQNVGSAPIWVNCQVSSLSLLPPINANSIMANNTLNFVAPQAIDVNRVLDMVGYDIIRPPVPESIIYKSNVGPNFNWQTLPPGVSGALLTSGGPTNPPFWSPTATQANLASICQTVGAVLYFDTPSLLWKCLNPGTSGQLLQTGGAAGNPSWLTVTLSTLGGVPSTRNVNTSAPLGGGGALSADLTLTCPTCATTTNGGALSATAPIVISAGGAISMANQGTTTTVLHGNAAGNPAFGAVAIGTDVSGLGTGVATALGVNIGTAGAPALNGGALGVATATSINGLSIFTSNSQANIGLGTLLPSQSGATSNVFLSNASALTTGDQNVILGTGGTGNALTVDTGNTLIGYDVAPLLHNAGQPLNFNSALGNQALRQCTTCGSNVAMGRASMLAETIGDHNTAVGHATLFTGVANVQTTAIGDSAGGAALAGTAIPAGFPNVGVNVFPFNGDNNLECIGETCGKATSAARKQGWCFGSYCRIPALDNVGWLGNGMQAVGTSGKIYEGSAPTTVNSATGVTLTCTQLLAGTINRTGAAAGAFSDTTPTAAQIVGCASHGAGNGAELARTPLTYFNNGTGQTATLVGGTGVTVGSPATIGNNGSVQYQVRITNSTSGAEAVSIDTVPDPRLSPLSSPITNSLGADVLMTPTSTFVTGPSIAQGATGTWWASGTVTIIDPTNLNGRIFCKLWDGTTIISSSAMLTPPVATTYATMALSGFITSPAGNIRISCENLSFATASIAFNQTGSSKDSTVSAFRVQ